MVRGELLRNYDYIERPRAGWRGAIKFNLIARKGMSEKRPRANLSYFLVATPAG